MTYRICILTPDTRLYPGLYRVYVSRVYRICIDNRIVNRFPPIPIHHINTSDTHRYISIHTIHCIGSRYDQLYTAPGTWRVGGSWNLWKRGCSVRKGPPQCQKSARKKITRRACTNSSPWSTEPYRNLYRKCIVTSRNYDTDPGPTYVSTSYHRCILAYRKFTCIGITIRQNTDTLRYVRIHCRYTRYGYGKKVPRYMGKKELLPWNRSTASW